MAVQYGHGRDIEDVRHGSIMVGKVDRLSQTDLNRTQHLLGIVRFAKQLVTCIRRRETREDQNIGITPLDLICGYCLSLFSAWRAKDTRISPSTGI